MLKHDDIVRLIPVAQNYAWGRRGSESQVSMLLKEGGYLEEIDEKTTYAELWMGTHPKGPATVDLVNGGEVPLLTYLNNCPLPYLFKVLSVNQSLSIQAHPDKVLAKKLHKDRPDIYKDGNHKPEMALALTNFQAMCGFRSYEQIATFLVNEPEFKQIAGRGGKALVDAVKRRVDCSEALREAFSTVMLAEKNDVVKLVRDLVERMKKSTVALDTNSLELPHLIQRLNVEYPGDVGIFCVYFLNVFELKAGEAVFLAANVPHAYLFGDCLECMAQSDNVVRAGLTPKLRDTKVLCEMLNYKHAGPPRVMKGSQHASVKSCTTYEAPIDEFALQISTLTGGAKSVMPMENNTAASILLVLNGSGELDGKKVNRGDVLLVPARRSLPVPILANDSGISIARCHCLLPQPSAAEEDSKETLTLG